MARVRVRSVENEVNERSNIHNVYIPNVFILLFSHNAIHDITVQFCLCPQVSEVKSAAPPM